MYEVQTLIGDQWENIWTEDGQPQEFKTRQEAQAEIDQLIADTIEAAAEGSMAEPYSRDNYRIFRIYKEGRLKRALRLLLNCTDVNLDELDETTIVAKEYAWKVLNDNS